MGLFGCKTIEAAQLSAYPHFRLKALKTTGKSAGKYQCVVIPSGVEREQLY